MANSYRGQLKGFPSEVVDKMLVHQVAQRNIENVYVFEKRRASGVNEGGFAWTETPEGSCFWHQVLIDCNFDTFFKKYPGTIKHLIEQEQINTDMQLPRVVLVSSYGGDDNEWKQRVLFAIKKGRYICWDAAETIEESEAQTGTTAWKYMKELPRPVTLTKQQIADKFGVPIDQLNIIV
jgi:hypothetical protein